MKLLMKDKDNDECLLCDTYTIVCCVDVVLQLVLRLVHYLLLLVHHVHYCGPYLNTPTPETMNFLKMCVSNELCLCLKARQFFPAKKTLFALKLLASSITKWRRPAAGRQHAGRR